MEGRTTSIAGRLVAVCIAVALAVAMAACGSSSSGGGGGGNTAKSSSDVSAYVGVGTLDSEYWAEFIRGAKAANSSAGGGSFRALADNFDPQKQLQNFGPIFGQGCAHCAMTIGTTSVSNAKPVVNQAVRARAYISVIWNKPADYHPWDVSPYWVAFTTFDGVDSGYSNAVALFRSMGGKGYIVALHGIPDNPPAIGRKAGLHRALAQYPNIHLLDEQVGNWDQATAQRIVESWLAKYGNRIGGVWTANDGMALGAVEALREHGLVGKVGVTGSDGSTDVLQLIKKGEITSTMYIDGAYQGALTMALAHAAAVGDIDPSKLTHAQREFYLRQTLVTKANVDQFLGKRDQASELSYDALKKDFWARSAGQVHGVS